MTRGSILGNIRTFAPGSGITLTDVQQDSGTLTVVAPMSFHATRASFGEITASGAGGFTVDLAYVRVVASTGNPPWFDGPAVDLTGSVIHSQMLSPALVFASGSNTLACAHNIDQNFANYACP
jgi:hypothetical protein